jgi:serine phosphatase RsbU (regulator of sigma subunit)/Tfp pilus assembly protein PilF
MKHISYLFLFLISFSGLAQEFAPKGYYLIDSLNLDDLTTDDKNLIAASLKTYHAAKDDTSKINALTEIIEPMIHQDWRKYQYYQYTLIKSAIASAPSYRELISLKRSLSNALNNIGYIYKDQGKIKDALDYFSRSLVIRKEIGDKIGIANSLNNIGYIYNKQGQEKEALDYYSRSLKMQEELDDKSGIATSLNNIGAIYSSQGKLKEALDYYSRSLKFYEEIDEKLGVANSLNNIGLIYKNQGQLKEALDYYSRSLKIDEEIGNKKGISTSLNSIGIIYYSNGNLNDALLFGEKSLTISNEIGSPSNITQASNLLSKVYENQGKGIKALEMYKLFIQMRDSINNQENQKATAQKQAKYAYEKQKTIDDAAHERQKAIDAAERDKLIAIEQEKKEKQQIVSGSISLGLILVVIFLFFVFKRLRIAKKQKDIIEQQKEVVEHAHDELEEKNQEIMDSIVYAKRIQSAILPPAKLVKEYLKESFILYKPKDIVAGDFYWMEQKDGKVFFAVADCTGHGVPGAMVSVVCNNALNRSVREYGLTIPGEILDKTRDIVVQEFEQSEEDVKDGMDIALCSIEGMKLQYAGAYNPLWIIRNGAIIETKANKQPIGQFDDPKPYTTHSFDLEQGDVIYIFSDGYVDQFGGDKGKKFKAKVFRNLLLSIQDQSMEEQNNSIDNTFERWKGDLEQIDDVCVIGVRV